MKKSYQLTEAGKKAIEDELLELKNRRGEIAEKIAESRDFGDLSENAEYDAARDEQGLTETRIAEIEEILRQAEIIKASDSSSVGLGSTVELESDTKTVTYQVVGPVEADPLEGRISNESPLGIQLMDQKIGDTIVITTPKGEISYKIKAIS